ncbi:MAG: ArsR family transcriptional regulator [Candidatus Odinarchaeum yellowstonii]|uniref:ArsR family transcriptional regulator n=1 Tax=Odinarchaeota yellowstonii (strain LCB_4) TaxID=1841599 RepID=A0AAF0D1Y3_ODILC|nr:MAG: ArsR family transcriptional regulator [Candidatus Odinarchaeum yellowstonii]
MSVIEKFKALSCETRYNIYNLLRQRQMSVEEISEITNLKPITVRHHIKELERSGLVCRRVSRFNIIGRPTVVYGVNSTISETPLTVRNYSSLQKIFFTAIHDFFNDEGKLLEFYNFMGGRLVQALLSGIDVQEFNERGLKDLKERLFLERLREYAPMLEVVEEGVGFFTIRLHNCPFLEHALPFFESICKILSAVYTAKLEEAIRFVNISIISRRCVDKPFCEFKISLKGSKNL